jgi:DNA-binding transcriptional regulator GbsR (MarR family)
MSREPHDSKGAFIEAFGVAMASQGLPRNAGRVLGALLVADPPEQTAEALAASLTASRGSISTMTRLLEGVGILERVSKPGERRHYYRVRRGGLARATAQRVHGMRAMADLAQRGLRLLEGERPEARHALEELSDFYTYWSEATIRLADAYLREVDGRGGSGQRSDGDGGAPATEEGRSA